MDNTHNIFKNYKFRPSELYKIMAEPRSKNDVLSETTLTYLSELYIEIRTRRRKIVSTDAMDLGIEREEEAINLYNTVKQTKHKKNEKTLENNYLRGTPDIIDKFDKKIIDIKIPQDIFTYPKFKLVLNPADKELKPEYYWQMQGYLALTGFKIAQVVYVLLDLPEWYINKQLKNKYYFLTEKGLTEEQINEQLNLYEQQIRLNSTYLDLNDEDRIFIYNIERNEEDVQKIYSKIELIRSLNFIC